MNPLLDKVADMPVVVPFEVVVDLDIPVVAQRLISMSRFDDLEILLLQYIDKVSDVPGVRVVQVPPFLVVKVVVIPQFQIIEKIGAIPVS